MRLICPNCSAQYEIDADLVPEDGRDVQCSNCGHTWFELPPAKLDADPEPDFETSDDTDTSATSDEPSQAARAIEAATKDVTGQDDTGQDDTEDDPFEGRDDPFDNAEDLFDNEDSDSDSEAPEDDDIDDLVGDSEFDEDDDDDDDDGVIVPPTVMTPRRPADAADLDILREEANRELSQRRAMPSDSLESQTDLGLDDLPRRESPSRALLARQARSGDPAKTRMMEAPGSDDGYKAPQRDLLPDIDEINSTLKPKKEVNEDSRRSGFRFGFSFVLFLFIAAVVIYAMAPTLARMLPDLEPSLIVYVDRANDLRDWINNLIGR